MIIIDKHIITEAFQNLSDLQFKRQRKLKESFGWERIDKKQVQDSDGFWTDYTLWYNSDEDRYMCIFGDDELYNPMNTFPDFECETEEEAREWFDSYNGFADDDDWMDESLKENIDISTYKEVSPENRGGTIYRLFRKVENGKGKWAAIEQCNGNDCGEPFEITYEQARGFEPMNSNEKAGMALGKKLLPKRVGLEEEKADDDRFERSMLTQKIFYEYPDISSEDEDYLNSLSYKDLVKEVRNRGWDEILKLDEDTVKQGKHWVNKGDSGKTHGKFATKKAADAQRKAMFANGYKESLKEDSSDSIGIFHNDNGIDYDIIERSESGRNLLLRHPRGSKWVVAWNCSRDNQGSWGQGHYFFDEMSARKLWNKEYANK